MPHAQSKVTVLEESRADGEWTLGYLDSVPAVADSDNRWFKVGTHTVLPQPSQQLIWFVENGEWAAMHQMHWDAKQVPPTDPKEWTGRDPDHIAR